MAKIKNKKEWGFIVKEIHKGDIEIGKIIISTLKKQ